MDTKIITCVAVLALSALSINAESPNPATLVKFDKVFLATHTRILTGEKQANWLVSKRESMPMLRREVGPFGLAQDPTKKRVQPREKSVAAEAFLNAIKVMNINLVDARKGKFAIGAREFKKGEVFPLIRGGRQFNTKVVLVSSDYIVFKNINSGEHVQKNLNTLPPGMEKNGTMPSIPGITPASEKGNVELNLDSQ